MSDQSEQKSESKGGDLLGLFLSGVGGLFFVSILLSFLGREPKEGIWTVPVVGLIEGIGRVAGITLSAGVAIVGTAQFLSRRGTSPGRGLFCLLGASLGLALLLGGLIPNGTQGGLLGRALPELWPGLPGRLLGALIGLGVVAASVAALRPGPRARGGARSKGERAALSPSLESRHGGEGVSAAEAEALTPAPRARAPLAPLAPLAPRAPLAPPAVPAPPAILPATQVRDVRLEGRIPPGARPLDPGLRDVSRPAYPGPVPEARREEPKPSASSVGFPIMEVRPVDSLGKGPAQPSWERASAVLVEPSEPWESPVLTVETPDVDAEASGEAEPEPAPLVAAVQEEAVEPAIEEPEPSRPARARRPRAPRTARAADRAAEPIAEGEALATSAASASSLPAWEQVGLFDEPAAVNGAEEEHEERVAADSEQPAAAKAEEPRAGYDDEIDFDDDIAGDDDDDEDDEDEDEDDEDEDEEDDDEDDEDEEEEEEDADLDLDLMTEVEVEASAGVVLEPEPAAAEPEPEKELAPAAPARPARERPGPARLDFEQLVHEAGCVVIEQNRVAVSMLQRSFQIDFDQACAVLDQLQERGLIGPYMGGRTRDILLTREEWVAQAPVV